MIVIVSFLYLRKWTWSTKARIAIGLYGATRFLSLFLCFCFVFVSCLRQGRCTKYNTAMGWAWRCRWSNWSPSKWLHLPLPPPSLTEGLKCWGERKKTEWIISVEYSFVCLLASALANCFLLQKRCSCGLSIPWGQKINPFPASS